MPALSPGVGTAPNNDLTEANTMSNQLKLSDLISKYRYVVVALTITMCSLLAIFFSAEFSNNHQVLNKPALAPSSNPIASNTPPASTAVITASQQHEQIALHSPSHPFTPSLEGTDIDGALQADVHGDLILNIAVKDLFDYFLNTVGEVSPEAAIGQILLYAKLHLPAPAQAQVMALLTDYINYREAALAVMNTPINPDAVDDSAYAAILDNALNQLKTLRRDYMSPAAVSAFFEMEEAYADYTLEIAQVQLDPSLSDEQKGQQTALLQAQLPPQLALSEQALTDHNRQQAALQAIVEKGTAQGFDEYALRAELEQANASPEAIHDILNQKQLQETFDTAYTEYLKERRVLVASGLVDNSLQSALDQLLAQHFPTEQMQTWAKLNDLQR